MPYPQMSMMPPVNMYHPMDPQLIKPPVMPTEYDPLGGGQKKAPPEIVKPPTVKPTIEPKPNTPTNKTREPPKKPEITPVEEDKVQHHQPSKSPHNSNKTRHQRPHGAGGHQHTSENSLAEAKNIIYVKNIPSYYNTVDALSKFFKRFGSIVNVKVDYSRKMASVEFQKETEAVKALNNRKPLFGDKNIFITKDPDATGPEAPANGKNGAGDDTAAATLKLNESLTEKLKFLISLKNFVIDKDKKAELMNRMNEIKAAQKSNKVSDNLHKLLETENYNLKFDYTLIVSDISKEILESKTLNAKLEVTKIIEIVTKMRSHPSLFQKYGKIEKLKINPKDLTAELKYFAPESARRVSVFNFY